MGPGLDSRETHFPSTTKVQGKEGKGNGGKKGVKRGRKTKKVKNEEGFVGA
jgi:hypothetical protein